MMLLDKTMYINSKIGDFKSFISTDTGFGTIEWKAGKPVLNVVYGNIDVKRYNVFGQDCGLRSIRIGCTIKDRLR